MIFSDDFAIEESYGGSLSVPHHLRSTGLRLASSDRDNPLSAPIPPRPLADPSNPKIAPHRHQDPDYVVRTLPRRHRAAIRFHNFAQQRQDYNRVANLW